MSRLFLISIFVIIINLLSGCKNLESINLLSGCKNLESNAAQEPSTTACIGKNANFSIEFFKANNQGKKYDRGINHVIIFHPQSEQLDFKVNVGLAHKLYAKDQQGKLRKEYVPKQFREIITDENSKLNGKAPIAAINADYIDTDNKPQGLNISRGFEYSGAFKNKRSSFGISGGTPKSRKATIQAGRRNNAVLNYNLVGGNGRFYRSGKFKDICVDLGEFACKQATNRSLAAITNKGYVILLVNDFKANSSMLCNFASE